MEPRFGRHSESNRRGTPFALDGVVDLVFEWDPEKARANLAKHGVSFDTAEEVFLDPLSLTVDDVAHSSEEWRLLIIGRSGRGQLLVVCHTVRGDKIRLIAARPATRGERLAYEEQDRR